MLGLWAAGTAPITLSLHVAFAAPLDGVLDAPRRLRRLGVTPLSFHAEETKEPSVIGWMPAAAVFFRDPDGHLLEYLAMLDQQPEPERGITPWTEWNAERTRTKAPDKRPLVESIRDALPDEAAALEGLQRQSGCVGGVPCAARRAP